MARDRSLVRASDIGAWTFCRRAWWLSQVKGVPHHNPALLQRGDDHHRRHGQRLVRATRWQQLGLFLITIGLLVAAGWLVWFLLSQ